MQFVTAQAMFKDDNIRELADTQKAGFLGLDICTGFGIISVEVEMRNNDKLRLTIDREYERQAASWIFAVGALTAAVLAVVSLII